jgi:hypothetical protein
MYRRGLEIFIRSLGLDRPSTIKMRENLTALLVAMGRSEEGAET